MDALALLRLQIEWGADEALSDAPVNRLAAAAEIRAARHAPQPSVAAAPAMATRRDADLPASATAERAAAMAAGAQSLADLRGILAGFEGFGLRETASNLVFLEGDAPARLFLIGEPPGADEDRAGRPFAGADGALLDKMLATIGLQRPDLLVAPLIPWRPPGGRPPSAAEVAVCLPFLTRMIELAAPTNIVLLGTLAARSLAPGRKRGAVWGELKGAWGTARVLTLPGLGATRKDPARRKEAWAGLRRLRRALDAEPEADVSLSSASEAGLEMGG